MNMEIIGPLLLTVMSGLSTVIGSFTILIKIKKVGEFITFSLSFSMVIMIMISIFELIPSSVVNIIIKYSYFYGTIISLLIFLLGYETIYFMNKYIHSNNSLHQIGILNMISLILHNFPEGIAVFISTYNNINIGLKLCLAIILHNIPEGITIAVPLYYSGYSRGRAILYTLFSSIAEPLGALLSLLFFKNIIKQEYLSFILIFVAGLMISLSINDIYKEIKLYNKNKSMILGLITGIIISIIIL